MFYKDIYTESQYVFILFIYGLSFFTMGVAALLQNTDNNSNFPLESAIKYLGVFGIVHGLTEWVNMFRILNIFPRYFNGLLFLQNFSNGLSFVFLWIFGLELLKKNSKYRINIIILPYMIFGILFGTFIILKIIYNNETILWFFKEDILIRYCLGLPGAIITAAGLSKNASYMKILNFNHLYIKLKLMSFSFFTYGILAGLIVNDVRFFPSTLLNSQSFIVFFGLPVEMARTIVAIIITILLLDIIKVFQWKINRKNEELMKYKILNDERKKIGHELHDVIIQNLFATGLQIENLMDNESNSNVIKELEHIKENLNNTIIQIRDFIKEMEGMKIQFEDLRVKITALVESFKNNSDIEIILKYNTAEITIGMLSQEKITHVYYIIKEAINNAVKHSCATQIIVELSATLEAVIAVVKDNGIGFDPLNLTDVNHYGLNIMRERMEKIEGTLKIKSSERGTIITVIVPWEVQKYERKL